MAGYGRASSDHRRRRTPGDPAGPGHDRRRQPGGLDGRGRLRAPPGHPSGRRVRRHPGPDALGGRRRCHRRDQRGRHQWRPPGGGAGERCRHGPAAIDVARAGFVAGAVPSRHGSPPALVVEGRRVLPGQPAHGVRRDDRDADRPIRVPDAPHHDHDLAQGPTPRVPGSLRRTDQRSVASRHVHVREERRTRRLRGGRRRRTAWRWRRARRRRSRVRSSRASSRSTATRWTPRTPTCRRTRTSCREASSSTAACFRTSRSGPCCGCCSTGRPKGRVGACSPT